MSHRLPTPALALLLAVIASFSAPLAAQQAVQPAAQQLDASPPTQRLNLSLPRDAAWSSPFRPGSQGAEHVQASTGVLPDFAASQSGVGQRGRQPYGTGYEARQRGSGDQSGGGRGMGRGR